MRAARAARAAGAVVAAVRAVVAAARAAEVARAAAVTAAVGSLYICPKVESHWRVHSTAVKSHRRNTYSTTDSRKRNPRSCTPRTLCSCTKRGRRTASSRERCRRPCTAVAELRLGTTMAIARTWPSAASFVLASRRQVANPLLIRGCGLLWLLAGSLHCALLSRKRTASTR